MQQETRLLLVQPTKPIMRVEASLVSSQDYKQFATEAMMEV